MKGVSIVATALLFAGAVIILICIVAVFVFFMKAKRTVEDIAEASFGTRDIAKAVKEQHILDTTTPKSISSMTRILLPEIEKDFPDFNWSQFKTEAELLLKDYLLSLSSNAINTSASLTRNIREQIANHKEDIAKQDLKETYKDILIHKTEIAKYVKKDGICMIQIQSAVQSTHFMERDGEVIKGSKDEWEQSKFALELQYVQDADEAFLNNGDAKSVVCTQCGAPVKMLGVKNCTYCGALIQINDIRVWKFNKIEKLG